MSFLNARRGSIAALAVGVTILALYVALQPGPRPDSVEAVATTTTTLAPTTTVDPAEELCRLAYEFDEAAQGQDVGVVARLAESFYERAREVAPPEIRPEYEAAWRYYTEYNNIGEQYDYDFDTAFASPDGQRWARLIFGEPLGVNPVRYSVGVQCDVALPPAPTITTTTTTRPPTTRPPETTAPPAPSTPPPTTPGTPATRPPAPATTPPATPQGTEPATP